VGAILLTYNHDTVQYASTLQRVFLSPHITLTFSKSQITVPIEMAGASEIVSWCFKLQVPTSFQFMAH
jgi:hypothetical protein